MNKLLIICGPTGVGKTSLGIKLAKKYNGEIVSADSRQVYRGMDIGTGKDFNQFSIFNFQFSIKNKYKIGYYEIDGVKVWLYDVVDPDYKFNVADYLRCVESVIKDIWKRKKLPILVGGTGFYIKALVDGVESIGVPPDLKLRKQLGSKTAGQLGNLLRELDPGRWGAMNESDRRNPRRLIRAIEIAQQYQISNIKYQKNRSKIKIDKILFIGLTANNKALYERIDRRVDERVKQGIVKEIQGLLKKGFNWENSALGRTIGYQDWRPYFKNSQFVTRNSQFREKVIQKWKYAEHKYARRQMTWFKKDKRIQWIDINDKKWQDRAEELTREWCS